MQLLRGGYPICWLPRYHLAVPRSRSIARGGGLADNVLEALGAPVARYGAVDSGPLASQIAANFSGGRYTERFLETDTIFYRVHGGKAGVFGREGTFVSPYQQKGGLQSQIDLGLRPEWGNTASNMTPIFVPAGTRIFDGGVSSQGGAWVGGAPQVFLPKGTMWPVR